MDTVRTDLRKLYTLFGTDSRNLGQRGQEPHPFQRLIPPYRPYKGVPPGQSISVQQPLFIQPQRVAETCRFVC